MWVANVVELNFFRMRSKQPSVDGVWLRYSVNVYTDVLSYSGMHRYALDALCSVVWITHVRPDRNPAQAAYEGHQFFNAGHRKRPQHTAVLLFATVQHFPIL